MSENNQTDYVVCEDRDKAEGLKVHSVDCIHYQNSSRNQPLQLLGMDLTNPKKKHEQYADHLQ